MNREEEHPGVELSEDQYRALRARHDRQEGLVAGARMLRAGVWRMWDVYGRAWTIEQRREYPAYGRATLWFSVCDDARDLLLDPTHRLTDALWAIART